MTRTAPLQSFFSASDDFPSTSSHSSQWHLVRLLFRRIARHPPVSQPLTAAATSLLLACAVCIFGASHRKTVPAFQVSSEEPRRGQT